MGSQLHLIVNHFPIVGMFFSIIIFLYILFSTRDSDDAKRLGVIIFFLSCLMLIPSFVTGGLAEAVLKDRGLISRVDEALIERHASFALFSYIVGIILGVVSLVFLIKFRKPKSFPTWIIVALLAASVFNSIFVSITGRLGEAIIHKEVREQSNFNPFGGRIFSQDKFFEERFYGRGPIREKGAKDRK